VRHDLWIDRHGAGYGHGSEGKGGGWPGLEQVLLVRTTREAVTAGAPVVIEDHFYLDSRDAKHCTAAQQLQDVREHWAIENRLHHVKDRTCHEDNQKLKRGAVMLAWLRSLATGCARLFRGATMPLRQITITANLLRTVEKLFPKTPPQTHPLLL
jgi:hypothetical protein